MAELAEALAYAHGQGVIHRDLKPANVMLTVDDAAVVLDFGLAKDLDARTGALTRTGEMLGTLSFMAPEQVIDF